VERGQGRGEREGLSGWDAGAASGDRCNNGVTRKRESAVWDGYRGTRYRHPREGGDPVHRSISTRGVGATGAIQPKLRSLRLLDPRLRGDGDGEEATFIQKARPQVGVNSQ
jgi:hypothetical protein